MPFLPPLATQLLGLDGDSTWEDRLIEAAYKSPSGTRIKFLYEDVERVGEKRGTVYEFPGVDGGYVQEHGFGARRYPLTCFFGGRDCDRVATAFEAALYERGIGTLEHPMYGKISVVPLGDIVRRDDLRTAANQSVVQVTFWTTIKDLYPNGSKDARSEIEAAIDGYDVVAAQKYADSVDLASGVAKANAKASVRALLREVSGTLQSVSDATSAVRREFDDTLRLINYGIDVFVGQPLLLAQQIQNLINAPARALAGIRSRLEGYAALANRIFSSRAGSPELSAIDPFASLLKRHNDFHLAQLFAGSAVSGSIRSTIEHTFSTRPEAAAAAADVTALFDSAVEWSDDAFAELGEVDTGESFQALRSASALAAGRLIEASFTLVAERRIVLDRPRTIVDLASELYGTVDDALDRLILNNALTGEEILELPRGRTILYYP